MGVWCCNKNGSLHPAYTALVETHQRASGDEKEAEEPVEWQEGGEGTANGQDHQDVVGCAFDVFDNGVSAGDFGLAQCRDWGEIREGMLCVIR